MGRITLFIAALAVSLAPGCRRDRSEPVGTPKTTETAAAAQDEAEAALETAREAQATADSALETARAASAEAAAVRPLAADSAWWTRPMVAEAPADDTVDRSALIEADRISVSGRITESSADRVVVAPAVGAPIVVRVDDTTQVALNGRAASAAELTPGTDVRLLYRLDGAQLVAERLDAQR